MRRKKSPLRSLRPAPAHEKARIAVTRLLAGGSCVFTVEQLAETAEVSTTTARDFVKAGIAAGLFVSAKTVTTYRSRVLQKLKLRSNAEIARYAASHDMI